MWQDASASLPPGGTALRGPAARENLAALNDAVQTIACRRLVRELTVAEAAAFAVHFLLATAASRDPAAQTVTLDHYDLLVPGTRLMARYFALQPIFRGHPLRDLLTTGRGS